MEENTSEELVENKLLAFAQIYFFAILFNTMILLVVLYKDNSKKN